jgi:tetratricopeptide (TPR) repeat protein
MQNNIFSPKPIITVPGLASIAILQSAQASHSLETSLRRDIKTFQNSQSSAGNDFASVLVALGIVLALGSTACLAYKVLNPSKPPSSPPDSQQKAKEPLETVQKVATLGNKQIAAAYIEKAYVFLRQGDVHRAIAELNNAIVVHPQNAYLYTERANFRRKNLGDQLGALEDYTQAINLHPDNALFYLWRSQVYHEMGEMLQAMADYNTAVRLAPEDTMYHFFQPNLQSTRH